MHENLLCRNDEVLIYVYLMVELSHDLGSYHIKTSPMICSENQWTDSYMIETYVMS